MWTSFLPKETHDYVSSEIDVIPILSIQVLFEKWRERFWALEKPLFQYFYLLHIEGRLYVTS